MAPQLWWYFGVLIALYALAVAAFWPQAGRQPNQFMFLALMYTPAVAAVVAHIAAGASIQWGRPNWWILAALIPSGAVLVVYLVVAMFGQVELDSAQLEMALLLSPLSMLSAAISAFGEEVGWRGFLWPTLRSRYGFWAVSGIVAVIWLGYHVPLILLGWYGSIGGLPAFTVAIVGAVLFVGVLTDRSRSLWPSVVFHAGWNALVATSFTATLAPDGGRSFSGSEQLLGEFGWLAALAMLIVGIGSALLHTRHAAT